MKKMILAASVILLVLAITSCGASRKYGCPAVAKNSNTQFIKA